MKLFCFIVSIIVCIATTCITADPLPPVFPKRPHKVYYGKVDDDLYRGEKLMSPARLIEDPYYDLRDDAGQNPQIEDHLSRENEFTKHHTKNFAGAKKIAEEIRSFYPVSRRTPAYSDGPYLYWKNILTIGNKRYVYHMRRDPNESKETPVISPNEQGIIGYTENREISSFEPSPSHRLIAIAIDIERTESFTIFVKDMRAMAVLPDRLVGTSGQIYWGEDDTALYYTTFNAQRRVNQVWKHLIGTPQREDVIVFEEENPKYWVSIEKTKSNKYLLLTSKNYVSTEVHTLDLSTPEAKPLLFQARIPQVSYYIDHQDDVFYIVTNYDLATNFQVMMTRVSQTSVENWQSVEPYDEERTLESIECFESFVVIYGRKNGLSQIWIKDTLDEASSFEQLQFNEPIYDVYGHYNKHYTAATFDFMFSSLKTPTLLYQYDLDSEERKVLHERKFKGYDPSKYMTEALHVPSTDGTLIPISLVYRADMDRKKLNPLHLTAYGAYGISFDPDFSDLNIPLISRGVIIAIAHVRGGGEKGKTWHEAAILLNRRKTFDDFISSADFLIERGYTSSEMMTAEGSSAGGTLIGAVINERPQLFRAVHAGVPFVDVLNALGDSSLPLNIGEWELFGNPNEAKFFDYIQKYSPYDNVRDLDYPNILVTTGFKDKRVPYWESAKWVQKLREHQTGNSTILLLVDMHSGHILPDAQDHIVIAYILEQLSLLD